MSNFQVGERVAEVPFYNWKMHVKGVPLAEIPDVRYGEIISKHLYSGGDSFYTVRWDNGGTEYECRGMNFISLEAL